MLGKGEIDSLIMAKHSGCAWEEMTGLFTMSATGKGFETTYIHTQLHSSTNKYSVCACLNIRMQLFPPHRGDVASPPNTTL